MRSHNRIVCCFTPGRTLRNEDQEPLFCGATPAPSSLDDEGMLLLNERALRSCLCR